MAVSEWRLTVVTMASVPVMAVVARVYGNYYGRRVECVCLSVCVCVCVCVCWGWWYWSCAPGSMCWDGRVREYARALSHRRPACRRSGRLWQPVISVAEPCR